MSSPREEGCWVCRKGTKSRCGSCQKGGLEAVFCSKECQRLVSPIHKLSCGTGKTRPFLLPPLSPEEVVEAKAHAKDQYKDAEGKRTSLTKALQKAGLLVEPLSKTLDTLASDSTAEDETTVRTVQLFLAAVRASEADRLFSHSTAKIPSPPSVSVVLGQVSRVLAFVLQELDGRPLDEVKDKLSALSPIMHHVAISYYLLMFDPKTKSLPGWNVDHAEWGVMQVVLAAIPDVGVALGPAAYTVFRQKYDLGIKHVCELSRRLYPV
ncbi:hypothetical protein JCM8097_004117 [Rhodosporidiobolus ruineniae]